MKGIKFGLLLVITALILGGLPLGAQQNVSRLVGTVSDPSGAVVPGAKVTGTNQATGLKVEMLTNSSGAYVFPDLPIGKYDLNVSFSGFQSYDQTNIVLISGQTATIDVKLLVGTATQTVTVTSAAPLMDVSTSNVATGSTNLEIQALPITLYGNSSRSAISIAKTYNGVSYDPIESGGQEFMVIGRAIINGTPWGQWAYNIDGVSGSVQSSEREHDMQAPTPDMIDEVRVTSNTDVSEPFSPGTSVDLTMKSGTNQLHGSLYEYLRNQNLDARETFLPTVPQDQQNNFGFSIGGPIVIPHLYNGKDKSFFFVSWDFYRFRSTFAGSGGEEATTATVATQAERNGDFSALLGSQIAGAKDGAGNPVYQGEIFNPSTQLPYTYNGQMNVIDPTLVSARSQLLLAQEALPNLPGTAQNWIGPNAEVRVDKDQLSIKFDQLINPTNRITFDWDKLTPFTTDIGETKGVNTGFSGHSFLDGGFGYLPNNLGESAGFVDDRDQYRMRLSYVWTIKPNLLMSARAAIIANPNRQVPWFPQTGATAVFGQTMGLQGFQSKRGPTVNISGFSSLGSGFTLGKWPDSSVPVALDFAWSKGEHNIKFGANYDLEHSILRNGENYSYGSVNFGPLETGLPGVSGTGLGIASEILGYADSASTNSTGLNEYAISGGWAFYVQDTWRITSKLTITPGIRWNYFMPTYEHNNEIGSFEPNIENPATGTLGAIGYYGSGAGRLGYNTTEMPNYGAWGGQMGLAYQLNPKTVIRANYGIGYAADWSKWLGIGGVGFPTYGISASFSTTSTNQGLTPGWNWANPFPAVFPTLPDLDPTLENGSGVTEIARNLNKVPVYYTPSFQIERELPGDIVVSVGYLGTLVRHQYSGATNQLNTLPLNDYYQYGAANGPNPGLLAQPANSPAAQAAGIKLPYAGFSGSVAQALLPYPQYTGVAIGNNPDGYSDYNALQFKMQKRVGHGLTALITYTDSKLLSLGTSTASGAPQSYYMKNTGKALDSRDEANIVAISWTYDLPVGKGKHFNSSSNVVNQIFGDWKLSAIQNYWTGEPLTVSTEAGIPFAGEWAVQNPGVPVTKTSCSNYSWGNTSDSLLNAAAFSTPAAYTFGNVHTLPNARFCGFGEEDFGLDREVKLKENKTVRFGTFWQNAFNRVDYQPDVFNNDINSSGFGRYGDAYPGRKIQFYLRFQW